MSKLLLHPRTAQMLEHLAANPPQALLFTGEQGSGAFFTAQEWLRTQVGLPPTNIRLIEPDEKTGISVAQIRALYQATRSKQQQKQFFILRHVGRMSPGAQNAFLKLLEEPNEYIYFILLATSTDDILPTIRSRTQHVPILPLEATAIQQLFAGYSLAPPTIAQISFIVRGRVGLATHLASNAKLLDEYRALAADAKTWLGGSTFERLCIAAKIGNDRHKAQIFLELAASMASALLGKAAASTEQQRWAERLGAIHTTLERLAANGNVKMQMTFASMGS